MPAFSVTIHGQNFLVERDGEVRRMGFVTRRQIEAPTPIEAAAFAMEEVRRLDVLTTAVRNPEDDWPTLWVEQIAAIDAVDPVAATPGLAWSPEDEASPES